MQSYGALEKINHSSAMVVMRKEAMNNERVIVRRRENRRAIYAEGLLLLRLSALVNTSLVLR